MNIPILEQTVWELAEDLALEKFYIKRDYHVAERPAFLLFRDFLGGKWSLAMVGIHVWRLSSKTKAYEKLREFATNSKTPIQIVTKTTSGWKAITEKKIGK